MQNNSLKLFLALLLLGTGATAQEADFLAPVAEQKTKTEDVAPMADPLSDFSATVAQKKAVDFPARSSLDTLELAPLPGIYETNITGPQPMAESVSVNDTPSEQLLGRLTPEVFQEMAELERDAAYLKLQIQKEQMKNDLENVRAQYRQSRLDEIAKREDVVRTRIQWWQEQEKLRQEVEKERQEAEEIKNKLAEEEALRAQQEAENLARQEQLDDEDGLEEAQLSATPAATLYSLVDIKGTRGQLTARLKNTATDEITTVHVGDNLNGEVITAITSEKVIVDRGGSEYTIKF